MSASEGVIVQLCALAMSERASRFEFPREGTAEDQAAVEAAIRAFGHFGGVGFIDARVLRAPSRLALAGAWVDEREFWRDRFASRGRVVRLVSARARIVDHHFDQHGIGCGGPGRCGESPVPQHPRRGSPSHGLSRRVSAGADCLRF